MVVAVGRGTYKYQKEEEVVYMGTENPQIPPKMAKFPMGFWDVPILEHMHFSGPTTRVIVLLWERLLERLSFERIATTD